jgi:poly(U)-specific endoribonuclease
MPWNEIWQADMNGNGIVPLVKGVSDDERNDDNGYLIVDLNPLENPSGDPNHQISVLTEVTIPENKKESYELVKRLLDNYIARSGIPDPLSDEEVAEIKRFLKFAIQTEPMKIVREHVERNEEIRNDDEWIELLFDLWFKTHRNDSISLFEHVFVGEADGRTLGGHHFWYHYYLHDGPFEVTQIEDTIVFIQRVEVQRSEVSNQAEVITIKYKYKIKDNHNPNGIDLNKNKGGFFVGLSAEGLMAFGTMGHFEAIHNLGRRHNNTIETDVSININEERYNLKVVHKDENGETFLRTFYPMIIT